MTTIETKKFIKELINDEGDVAEKSVQYNLKFNETRKTFSVYHEKRKIGEFDTYNKASKHIKNHFKENHKDEKVECGFFNEGHIEHENGKTRSKYQIVRIAHKVYKFIKRLITRK